MPRVDPAGVTLPGQNRIIDAAGWQCVKDDLDEPGQRCRRIATHTHRTRDGERFRLTALCPRHYELAGPEAVVR